jgi:hypothetical protein
MCRNIQKLRRPERLTTDEELAAAALQFVRKISGYQNPSKAKEAVFERAINEIAMASRPMFERLTIRPTPSTKSLET